MGIRIFEQDVFAKSIDTYDLMDYIAQTIVAPSKQSRELIVNKNVYANIYGYNEVRQIRI